MSQHGYEVAVRTAISRNKYNKEFLNTGKFQLERISSSVLDKFNIVIADATELTLMNKQELASIQSAVFQKGLGLIVKADSAVRGTAFFSALFPITGVSDSAGHAVAIQLADTAIQLPALQIEDPLYIRYMAGTQPLAIDGKDRIYVSSALYGNGKILLTTLHNTFSWPLSDKQDQYNSYWAGLLNKVAGKAELNETWGVAPAFPIVNKPVRLYLHTNNGNVPRASTSGEVVYMKAHAGLAFEWSGTYWPRKSGWQPLIQSDGKTYWWYAYENNDWKNIAAARKINATRQYALQFSNKTQRDNPSPLLFEKTVPKIYFLLLFIIACGFLWFEKKFYDTN